MTKKFRENNISNFLNTFEISIISNRFPEINNFKILEIESKNLEQKGLCMLGK